MIDRRAIHSGITCKRLPFEALDVNTLYDVLKLRMAVFCVEQNCVYQDLDDKDKAAWHVLVYKEGELAATARILMPDVSYPNASSIGRVVTAPKFRGQSIGRALMTYAISQCEYLFPKHPIRIGAQRYLEAFYQSFGFTACSEPYMEDGIEHIEMEKLITPKPSV